MKQIHLSVIILNFNTKEYLRSCLQSIKQSKDNLNKEIYVVDNASIDRSAEMVKKHFPEIKLLQSKRNIGYAAGNNLALKKAKGNYILLLNSDTKIFPDTLSKMIKYMDDHPEVGASTCRVELENGKLDPACHRGFPTPWASLTYFLGLENLFPKTKAFGQYHQGWKDVTKTHEIDSPVGAFYLTRKRILDKTGLLDERFFMYAEDLDLSMRIKNKGWKIMFVPDSKIIHYKKTSGRKKLDKGKLTPAAQKTRQQSTQHFFNTMKQFYDKHYKNKYPQIVHLLMLAGIFLVSKIKK